MEARCIDAQKKSKKNALSIAKFEIATETFIKEQKNTYFLLFISRTSRELMTFHPFSKATRTASTYGEFYQVQTFWGGEAQFLDPGPTLRLKRLTREKGMKTGQNWQKMLRYSTEDKIDTQVHRKETQNGNNTQTQPRQTLAEVSWTG